MACTVVGLSGDFQDGLEQWDGWHGGHGVWVHSGGSGTQLDPGSGQYL